MSKEKYSESKRKDGPSIETKTERIASLSSEHLRNRRGVNLRQKLIRKSKPEMVENIDQVHFESSKVNTISYRLGARNV